MRGYQRDEHALPMYEFTCQLATDGAPAARGPAVVWREMGQPKSYGRFVQMNAGTISPSQFFSPENVGAIMA
jgi:hypothetical protein